MITLRFDNRCTCRLNLPPNFAVFFQARKMCPGKSQKTLRAPGWQKIRTAIITFCLAPGKANRNRQSGVKMGNSSRRGRWGEVESTKWRLPFASHTLISENWQHKSVGNFVTEMGGATCTPITIEPTFFGKLLTLFRRVVGLKSRIHENCSLRTCPLPIWFSVLWC